MGMLRLPQFVDNDAVQNDRELKLQQSLRKLSKDLQIDISSLPIYPFSLGMVNAPAFTDDTGIYIREDVLEKEPENVHVYIAHEIFHHVVADHQVQKHLDRTLLNIAADYKINYLLFRLYGYDVRAVRERGLFNVEYGRLKVEVIAEKIAKQKLNTLEKPCGCSGLANKEILKIAAALKRRYRHILKISYKDLFVMDLQEEKDFHSVVDKAESVRNYSNLDFLPMEHVLKGLWAALYQSKSVALNSDDYLTPSQAVGYCVPYHKFRSATTGDVELSILAATKILKNFQEDARHIDYKKRKLEEAVVLLAKKPKKNRRKLLKSRESLRKIKKLLPVTKLLAHNLIAAKKAKPPSIPVQSLRSATKSALPENDIRVPNYDRKSLTAKRIRVVSTRCLKDIKNTLSTLEEIQNKLGNLSAGSKENDYSEVEENSSVDRVGAIASAVGTESENTDKETGAGKETNARLTGLQLISASQEFLKRIFQQVDIIETMLKNAPKKKSSESNANPTNFNYGNDLSRVVSSELALLAEPSTSLDFLIRLSNHSLFLEAPPVQKRYPIVICIDGSGSMRGSNYETALAFALAMVRILSEDKRGIAVLNFSGHVTSEVIVDQGKPINTLEILKVLLKPTYGGTDFDSPLLRGFAIKKKQQWKEVLVLMVTDGYCGLSKVPEIKSKKSENDKIVGVVTTNAVQGLQPVADTVFVAAKRNNMLMELVEAGQSML